MYFSLQWWGSGSVIDFQGRILTNSHVVDDGFWGISDDFSVCITDNPTLPPKCHYTASVISRDTTKDIALLQIDPTDIFGRPVNFNTFTTLPLDYSYVPNSGDAVIARGYPWVGANTITETQGIVSGTYSYNNNTYIKTDTLIAGGNSGGPLIRDGKMVGINTFLIGGSSDPALGYSLSVREAQDFIQSGIASTKKIQTNSPKFPAFLQSVDAFTQGQKIVDKLITINLPQKYNISTYIPGSVIEGQISEENTTAVYAFSVMHFATPKLQTPEEIRYFLASQSFFPFSQDVKFRNVTIGGQSFYAVDTLGNTGGDKTKTQYVYFKIINERNLLLLQLATPFSTETTYPDIQKNITAFLSGISFPAEFTFHSSLEIDITPADLTVKPGVWSLVDFRSNFFPYNGVISELMVTYDDLFTMRTYLGNLWSYAQVSVVPNSFYTADTSASELLAKLNEVSYFSENTESRLITYRGHEGFIACDTNNWSTVTDEKKSTHAVVLCEAILIIGEDDSHFLSLMFLTDKNKKSDINRLMVQHLDNSIALPDRGETDFGTTSQGLAYTDIDNQSPEFQDALRHLLKYGILSPRNLFDGDHPLTWDEYARLHIWAIYHKRLTDQILPGDDKSPTFDSVLGKLPVNRTAYVNSAQRDDFELMLRLRLAGVVLPSYTEESLEQFKTQKDTKYRAEWQKIEDFEYRYFMGQKMAPNGASYYNSGYYTPKLSVSYNPVIGISREPVFNTKPIRFWSDEPSKIEQYLTHELECTRSSARYFSSACFRKRQEYIWWVLSYPVLTKGEALNAIIPSIDFALWDEVLARKKMVQIEEWNN
jgi:hypothetical protein